MLALPKLSPPAFSTVGGQLAPRPPLPPTLRFARKTPSFHLTRRSLSELRASATNQSSLSTLITDLEDDQPLPQKQPPEELLPKRWREIHGSGDWAGLLDPMDPLLRSELIRYGEMTQACYDSFDFDPYSCHFGSCKYNRRQFFQSLGMPDAGYEVTRYLYATASITIPKFSTSARWARTWSERADWIGYVAVSTDEASARLGRRDIIVAWRGTVTRLEWVADLMDFLRPLVEAGIPCPDPHVKVESGFMELYTGKDPSCRFCKYSAREQVLAEVRKQVDLYTGAGETVSVTVTGHSLGSALAMLSAYDMVETGATAGAPVCVFSFAGPRVGNGNWKERFENGVGVKALRVVNKHDKVPKVPGIFFNERVPAIIRNLVEMLPWTYSHVGVELTMDHKHSPFLKETNDVSCYHNLEAHLHLLDGFHGPYQEFGLVSGRDPALVNKSSDFLIEQQLVPAYWRQDENKGMIRADGRWIQPERPKFEDHFFDNKDDNEDTHDTHHHLSILGLFKQQPLS